MRNFPSLSRGLLCIVLGFALGAAALCALGHFLLGIRFSALVEPWIAYSGLGALVSPLLYWSLKRDISSGDRRAAFCTIAVMFVLGSGLLDYYIWKLGFISTARMRELLITLFIAVPPCVVAAFYVSLKVRPPVRGERSQGLTRSP